MTDSSFEENINAYFVNVGGNSNGMLYASDVDFENSLTLLRKHIPDIKIKQIQPSEGFLLIAAGQLTKKDVFVFNRFEGDFFKQLQQTKALLVGARCLITCLLHRQEIPFGNTPVYTTAMRNLHISATGITAKEKEHVRKLVEWMGGYYFADFGRGVTHLVSKTIRSNKYEQATLNGITVMHVDWVQRVWERSCVDDVNATDKEFDKYTLPIFFGTNITCSGLATDKKNEISQLVNANGGTYHSCFRSQLVDILITEKSKTGSEKYKAAVRFHKDILLPEWIFDSVTKGYALPMKNYQVKSLNASTPTKTQQSIADFTATNTTHLSDISRISAVGAVRSNLMSSINETICSIAGEKEQTFVPPARPVVAPSSSSNDLQREVLKKSNYRVVLDEIDPKVARSAGTFLDGCSIYLCGFKLEEREKLNRILNVGGATRYDVVNEKITHIIVGKFNETEYKSWKNDGILSGAHIVSLNWLLESIKIKQPASEVVYRMPLPATQAPETPSPSSKRTLRSMNHSFKQPDKPVKKKLFDNNNEQDVPDVNTPPSNDITITEQQRVLVVEDDDEHNLITQYSQEHLATESGAVPLPPKRPTLDASHASDNTTLHAPPIASSTQCAPNVSALMPAAAPGMAATNETEMTDTIDYEHLNFLEGVTVYVFESHFRDEFYSQIMYECEAAKGDLVSASFRDTIDYAIVSFERTLDPSTLPVKAKQIVNDLYVETCLKQNKFTAIEYYHKHIPHTADSHPLKDMTIVVSTYSGLERDFVDSIAELLGARVNKTFVKKEKPLLVCPLPEGSKYQGAIKWGYPVVTSQWLLDCAAQGLKLSFQPYLVGKSVADFPISPTLRERNSDSNDRTQRVDAPQDELSQHMDMDVDIDNVPIAAVENRRDSQTPSTSKQAAAALASNITPLRNRRVSELAGPLRNMQTNNNISPAGTASPHTPTNHMVGPTYDIEIMESMLSEIEDIGQRECWREIINEIRNNPTPQLERIRRQACTPNNRGKWPSPKGIPEFCTTPAYKQRMRDEFERRYRLPIKEIAPDTPMEEICKRVLYATCKTQGIPIGSAEKDHQHQQQQQQNRQQQQETRDKQANTSVRSANGTPVQRSNAKNGSPAFAMPRTLFDNQHISPNTSRTYVPETQTPNTSKDQANLSVSGIGQRASVLGKSTIDFDKISFEDTELVPARVTTSRPSTSSNASNASVSPEVKQITDYLKSFETRRQSLKRSAPDQLNREDNIAETEGHFVQVFESEQFGGTEEMVGWQDPAQFSAGRLSKMVAQMQHNGTPHFSISCTQEETKQDIITKIQKLGGEICENLINFDASCTHFLCERPNRGEKILGCISSGKWVLSLRYIEESYAKNTFVDEELFEWGNCRALNMPQLNSDEQLIALAAHRWRRELFATKGGAFTGIRAILHLPERHLNALKTVIKAGKGEIIEAQPPYTRKNQVHLATHCFVDVKRSPLKREDYNFLIENNVKVLTQMYIHQYLMSGRDADYTQYEVKI